MKNQICLFAVVLVFAVQSAADAQTLQQPVIERFGVNTTVSVPDRGRTLLGSISRAQSFRRQRGFFQPGSTIGYSRSHTGLSVGVHIIDLREMDRMILGYDPSMLPHGHYSKPVVQTPQQVQQKKVELTASRKPGLSSAWLRLGKRAEERGKLDRARDCYARAKANGSTEARERLAALGRPKSKTTPAKKGTVIDLPSPKVGPRLLPQTR